MPVYRRRIELDHPVEEVFAWHRRPGAVERLSPPYESVRVVERRGGLEDGGTVTLKVSKGPVSFRWTLRHTAFEENRMFRDEQLSGPFGRWVHTHRFLEGDGGGTVLEDEVDWEPPLAPLGTVGEPWVEGDLEGLFFFRHERLKGDLARHARRPEARPWTVAVTGSTGLVGDALVHFLTTGGHRVRRVVRHAADAGVGDVLWDPREGRLDPEGLRGVDAVVHLAGEPLMGVRWTRAKKERIRESRTRGTALLARTLASMDDPPSVLVSASGVHYYGDRGNEIVTEKSPPGRGFLADVCRKWEAATEPARKAGIRVVVLRAGVVLSPAGGALGTMLLPFKLGIGGRLGSGRQYWSWIDHDDHVGLIHHAIGTPELEGPVNATSPHPVTNATFTDTLGRVLGRPTLIPLPGLAVRALFGEMGETLLLEGARAVPSRAQGSGFEFLRPGVEESLRFQMGRPERGTGG